MNCPSRVDSPFDRPEYSQRFSLHAPPLTSHWGCSADRAPLFVQLPPPARQRHEVFESEAEYIQPLGPVDADVDSERYQSTFQKNIGPPTSVPITLKADAEKNVGPVATDERFENTPSTDRRWWEKATKMLLLVASPFIKFGCFIGPGFMIAVAYIDPGNYSTDVSAGTETRFSLLFVVLLANIIAIYLQSLCIKLGSVTGLNLAENCRAHLPRWINLILYVFAEVAIIATDISEVVGSAIALNLLGNIPLVAGCAITLADVFVTLFFYRPNGKMVGLRAFEYFVMALVLAVVICFCMQLSMIRNSTVGQVFKGYLPSSAVVRGNGLYLSCGILGATVMPHSLFLGSGVVQSRLKHFDVSSGYVDADIQFGSVDGQVKYRPSLNAIRACMNYSIAELTIALFTFALFVNSSILIVAGASLYHTPGAGSADLFGIYALLSRSIAPAAAIIFAVALLLSGLSAGVVCTIAGQIVSEGMLNWSMRPWLRRLITRSISVIPSIIVAAAVGRQGLNDTLNACQVALSVILPFVSAPLIWFTCFSKYMTVATIGSPNEPVQHDGKSMRNNIVVAVLGALIWLLLAVLNIATLVLVGLGKS